MLGRSLQPPAWSLASRVLTRTSSRPTQATACMVRCTILRGSTQTTFAFATETTRRGCRGRGSTRVAATWRTCRTPTAPSEPCPSPTPMEVNPPRSCHGICWPLSMWSPALPSSYLSLPWTRSTKKACPTQQGCLRKRIGSLCTISTFLSPRTATGRPPIAWGTQPKTRRCRLVAPTSGVVHTSSSWMTTGCGSPSSCQPRS
mmetsp:Transcript_10304/g.32655  ORF Transcript_10304/g.32655 Transcript_10304/m.32655 type:complete len:202 (+) Transcript_10304:598-1203(+)